MKIEHFRDLTLLHIDEKNLMVVTCDSSGAIGMKELDEVKVPYEILGYFTVSVALCELLAFGAVPSLIVDNICMEMKTAGEGIINGINQALDEIGLDGDKMLTGSTEENMTVKQSGLGITCIGMIDKQVWEKPKTYPSDDLFLIGTPKVGDEVVRGNGLSNLQVINKIKQLRGIHEILPVGSKGVGYEVKELCLSNAIEIKYSPHHNIDLQKSAGPATCVLVSGEKDKINNILGDLDCEYGYLGSFV